MVRLALRLAGQPDYLHRARLGVPSSDPRALKTVSRTTTPVSAVVNLTVVQYFLSTLFRHSSLNLPPKSPLVSPPPLLLLPAVHQTPFLLTP